MPATVPCMRAWTGSTASTVREILLRILIRWLPQGNLNPDNPIHIYAETAVRQVPPQEVDLKELFGELPLSNLCAALHAASAAGS